MPVLDVATRMLSRLLPHLTLAVSEALLARRVAGPRRKTVVGEGRVLLVSRHPGARAWAARRGLRWDLHAPHLDLGLVRAGDRVFGNLPAHAAAAVCARGADYWHLRIDVPHSMRGRELAADELERCGARFVRIRAEVQDG